MAIVRSLSLAAFTAIRTEPDGEVSGYIPWVEKSGFRAQVVMELEQIAVGASRRRRGVGTALIAASLRDVGSAIARREATLATVLVTTRSDNDTRHP